MHALPLTVSFRPSRVAMLAIIVAYGATAGLCVTLPWPLVVRVVAIVFVVATAVVSVRNVVGRAAPAALQISIDRRIRVTTRDGREASGEVHASSYVGAYVTTIVWRPDGCRMKRSVLVLPDTLAAEEFRRLRVMLRYSRSSVSDGREGRSDVDAFW